MVLDRESWDHNAHRLLADAERTGSPATLLFLDLDKFKTVNDTYGHIAGDRVLAAASSVLQQGIRSGDLLGRYGGDEFVLLLANAGLTDALRAAQEIRDAIRSMRVTVPTLDGETATITTVTVSVGVAGYSPQRHRTLDRLLLEADRALYAAKRAGRNQVCPASPLPQRKTLI
ncbi:GGDEF domain-containing protein [Kutzneria albida]|uniref:GGDEF domain-containing protein n=1 Tax=Kutzneria albida TaxID=43357 RepID=UPI00068CB302|nr:GGDEF domain-containing protein [Kutzneria albida]